MSTVLKPLGWIVMIVIGLYGITDAARAVGLLDGQFDKLLQVAQTGAESYPPTRVVEWWDIARTGITLIAVGALTYIMFQSRTSAIYKEERDAQRDRADRLEKEQVVMKADALLLKAETASLRARTDLTEVIRGQQEMLLLNKQHDAQMIKAITDVSTRGEKQYGEAMKQLVDMMNYLGEGARTGISQAKENHTLILQVIRLIDERWKAA